MKCTNIKMIKNLYVVEFVLHNFKRSAILYNLSMVFNIYIIKVMCVNIKGIVHRDIKLGNVFLNHKMQVKIGDFGLSAKLIHHRDRRYTTCGTPNYIAPEILA